MSNNLYITSTESRSGKSAICLGVMEILLRNVDRVGFFRPLINVDDSESRKDNDIDLISSYYNLKIPYEGMYANTTYEANELISMEKQDELIENILNKYKRIEKNNDFVLCEGTDFVGSTSSFEFDINAEIANNLGCPVLLVANANNKTVDETIRSIDISIDSLMGRGCKIVATLVNRVDSKKRDKIIKQLNKRLLGSEQLLYLLPDEKSLGNPTVGEIAEILDAEILYGEEQLNRHVRGLLVAGDAVAKFP